MRTYAPTSLALLGLLSFSGNASAVCDDALVTNATELSAAVDDYNANCGDGETLTVTLSGAIMASSGIPTINNSSTAVLEFRDGAILGDGTGRLCQFTAGNVIFERVLLSGFSGNNGGIGRVRAAATLTINNSTLTGNSATSGALFSNNGTITLTNSTASGNTRITNGGAIFNFSGSTLNLNNSILANTVNGAGDPVEDCLANNGSTVNFSAGLSNIIETETDGNSTCDPNGLTRRTDPGLEPLNDNGGLIQTFALAAGSPAIDAGQDTAAVDADGAPLSTDGRGAGFPRIVGTSVDIGAFEAAAPAPSADTVTVPTLGPLGIALAGLLAAAALTRIRQFRHPR